MNARAVDSIDDLFQKQVDYIIIRSIIFPSLNKDVLHTVCFKPIEYLNFVILLL